MEHQKHEGNTKRPIALPITLVLLVFSLMGNVYLSTLYLQNKQDAKYEIGLSIYQAAEGTIDYFKEMNELANSLLNANGLEERMDVLYRTGSASAQGEAAVKFLEFGKEFNPETIAGPDAMQAYLDQVNRTLSRTGSYEGPLKETDRAQLEQLKLELAAKEAIVSKFNLAIIDYKTSVIRMAAGYGWIEVAEELHASLSK